MTAIDISTFNGVIDFVKAKADGVTRIIIRGPIGSLWVDDRYHANWAAARLAEIAELGVYCDVVKEDSASAHFLNIVHQTNSDYGTEPVALDCERTNAERDAISAGTLVWNKITYTQLVHDLVLALQSAAIPVEIYTSRNEWLAITTDPTWAIPLMHWIAQYNNVITEPERPDGWDWRMWQKGQMQVAGIAEPVDYSVEKPMSVSPIGTRKGSLIGIHAINPGDTLAYAIAAVLAGAPLAGVKIMNDAEALAQVKQASPETYCYLRYFNPTDDSLQGIDDWSPANEDEWCDRVLLKIYGQITMEQCKWIDAVSAWNEEDPPPPGWGYQKLGQTFLKLGAKNEARRLQGLPYVKLAFGCLAQGTPELWEMDELIATGLFAWMQAHDYPWDDHEGAFAWQQITEGMGDSLPSTPAIKALGPGHGDVPAIPGSGSGSFRFVWMFEGKLRPLGQLVKLIIGEWYPGVLGQLERYWWYDDHASLFEYVVFFAGYNFGHTPDWPDLEADYNNPAFKQHRIDIKDRINGGLMPTEITDPDLIALHDHHDAEGIILAKYPRPVAVPLWHVGDKTIAAVDPIVVYKDMLGTIHDTRHSGTSIIDIVGVPTDVSWVQVFLAPPLYCHSADLKPAPAP